MHCHGLLDADPGLLLRAADGYEKAGRPLPRAQALEAAADRLLERGDAAAARGPFVAAVDIYAAMGASWAAKRLRAPFRAHGMRPPTRRLQRPAVGWEALTPAEAKVAELVAAGRSNPEIAEELMLSRHTVLTHVARVLAKLQVRSRVDVARAAADRLAPAGR
jgi:DNA-binding CsgD family transcriptional regulator